MGGPGILFNTLTLLRLKDYIRGCLKSLQTSHEDVEVGRCVYKNLNISCTNNLEMKKYFKHFYPGKLPDENNFFTDCPFFSQAITMHPFKSTKLMLQMYSCALKHQRHVQNYKIAEFLSEIKETERKLESFSGYRKLHIDENPNEVAIWDTYTHDEKGKNSMYGDSYSGQVTPKKFPSGWKKALKYLTGIIEQDLNTDFYGKGRTIKYRGVNYVYGTQMENHQGTSYVLDLNLTNFQISTRKETEIRKQIHLKQRFLPLRIHPLIETVNERFGTKLNVILPLYKKSTRFETFLINYERNFLSSYSDDAYFNIHLVVVVFAPYAGWGQWFQWFPMGQWFVNESDKLFVQDVERMLTTLKDRYPKEFNFSITNPIRAPFSRARGLDYGAKLMCKNPNDLMFFVDVDIFFNLEAVNTIRFLVIQGKTVYFPIVYSTFGNSNYHDMMQPDEEENIIASSWRNVTNFDNIQGYWRNHGYGMVAMYKSDYVGMDLSIHGWGKEDVALYRRFQDTKPHLELIRSADPNIIHLYHPVHCDPNLPTDQLKMCYKSSYGNYRSTIDAALEVEQLNITHW